MLVHRPKAVICKIGTYDIIVSSDNPLEQESKFTQFCQEFKTVLMMVAGQASPAVGKDKVAPIVANEGMS